MKIYLFTFFYVFLGVQVWAQFIPTQQNPKFSTKINPKFNSQINPNFNTRIDPRFNPKLNPHINSELNPKFNTRINPKYNTQVNPEFNPTLNPKFTLNLNPLINYKSAKYLYDKDNELIGLLSKANKEMLLLFDIQGEWIGYFIKVKTTYIFFHLDGEWTGEFLSPDSEKGFNWFDENGNWTEKHIK